MELTNIIQLVSGGLVALFNIIVILIALKKKKEATSKNNAEEEKAMEEIIKDQMKLAIDNIKSVCSANNLMFNAKQTSKLAKKIIKEDKK